VTKNVIRVPSTLDSTVQHVEDAFRTLETLLSAHLLRLTHLSIYLSADAQ
jgi:hypothetical protein